MNGLTDSLPFWCPINEISFLSWGGGDAAYLNPFANRRRFELKCQLARAAIAAIAELRAVGARARFVHAEPLLAIHHDPAANPPYGKRRGIMMRSFKRYLLGGWIWPQMGGSP